MNKEQYFQCTILLKGVVVKCLFKPFFLAIFLLAFFSESSMVINPFMTFESFNAPDYENVYTAAELGCVSVVYDYLSNRVYDGFRKKISIHKLKVIWISLLFSSFTGRGFSPREDNLLFLIGSQIKYLNDQIKKKDNEVEDFSIWGENYFTAFQCLQDGLFFSIRKIILTLQQEEDHNSFFFFVTMFLRACLKQCFEYDLFSLIYDLTSRYSSFISNYCLHLVYVYAKEFESKALLNMLKDKGFSFKEESFDRKKKHKKQMKYTFRSKNREVFNRWKKKWRKELYLLRKALHPKGCSASDFKEQVLNES